MKYPFLPQARQLISGVEFDYETAMSIPLVRERAKQRVAMTFDFKAHSSKPLQYHPQTEVASYALALAYVSGIGDAKLIERFALYEANRINSYLRDEENEEILLEIADAFEWKVKLYEETKGTRVISIDFARFLSSSTRGRLHHEPSWKLVNRVLEKGWVRVSPFELARLLQEDVRKRIQQSAMIEIGNIPKQMQDDINELKGEFQKMKPQLEDFYHVIKAQESEYPPCIGKLLKRATKGQHMSHTERFTLVTYLIHQGLSVDSIVKLFSNVSDFNEEKTRYQVEHLAGKRYGGDKPYVTYNCSTLQTHGVCSGPVDQICMRIKNPLTYHLIKQGKAPRKNRD